MSKKQEYENKIEIDQIKINRSEYEKRIVRLIECLLEIDEADFEAKIANQRTIERLNAALVEKQRPIFSNLIKFVEIHPMKIKIGMYAPAKEALKATGTDGIRVEGTETQEKEGKLIPFNPTQRVGSSTDGNGAREGT